ncbi:hypothetical protein [Bosea rubneri]|uniref:Uncharacterized protein n=1 Tax=Bosea rubneri TaxID=3075434 RepID=A0ABU3SFU5_9HYPH|nr:hypothetical protein [Bosea sp. ZW T0_25]MDU0343651.1 hypothetical protein [Bosea sp. ZW T0_25]
MKSGEIDCGRQTSRTAANDETFELIRHQAPIGGRHELADIKLIASIMHDIENRLNSDDRHPDCEVEAHLAAFSTARSLVKFAIWQGSADQTGICGGMETLVGR